MPRPRKRPASPGALTVSRPALLVEGGDGAFRGLIHDLLAHGARLEACRDAFAGIAGVSGVQYEILMLLSRSESLPVGEVAAALHRSGAFITTEAARLAARGLVDKRPDPADGRRVRLALTRKGAEMVRRLAPVQRQVNDTLFECLDARRFRALRALAAELAACADRGAALAEFLAREAAGRPSPASQEVA